MRLALLRGILGGSLGLLAAAGLARAEPGARQRQSVLPPPLVERRGVAARQGLPFSAVLQDTFPLAIIATIDSVVNGDVTFGDTDRDGLQEIVTEDKSTTTFRWQLVIVEEQGDNTYEATYPLGLGVHVAPYTTGDLDGDGKMEIVGQVGALIHIYESVDGTTFPSQLVWESPPLTNIGGKTGTGDTDRDGRMELIHSRSGFGGTGELVIFENTGDDAYVEVASLSMPGNAATYEKAIADLDGDGWPEIAACGNGGLLYIFEACGNDAWRTVWVDSTGLHNAYAAEGGWDTDGNGRPEIFIMGNNFEDATWDSRVYEACGDDQYRLVATLAVPVLGSGIPNDALGDLDGDGDGEYVMETGPLWIFDSVGPGRWQLVGVVNDPGDKGLAYTHDLNRNGRWEIVWRGSPTWILERPVTSDTAAALARPSRLAVVPNPVHLEAQVAWGNPLQRPQTLAVYDVAGRLVSRRAVTGSPFLWSTRALPAGTYFLRLEGSSGVELATGRAVVSR